MGLSHGLKTPCSRSLKEKRDIEPESRTHQENKQVVCWLLGTSVLKKQLVSDLLVPFCLQE